MAGKRDPDTPTDTEPKHMTSTPFSSDSKPDVAEMFKKMGDKLGWFQYNNLETAYKTLSKSSKKKSTKSRIKKETPNRRKDEELSKAKHFKENKTLGKDREQHKLSFNTSPLKENQSQNISSEDFLEPEPVPPRKSKACTDLTKEWRINQNSKKKLSRISIIPSAEAENISHGLITHGDKRYSISNADVGCPVQESTRIHSRQSIDNLLDNSEDSNRSCEGRNQSGELKQNISEEDSYRQLHIMKKRPNLGDDKVIDAMNLLKINRSKEEETQFYTTAHCEVSEQDLLFQTVMEDGDKSPSNDVSKSERRVEESENIQSEADSSVERLGGSDSSSYVELVDASAQVEKSCLSSSEIVEGSETASNSQGDSHHENSESSGKDSFCEKIVKVTEIQSQEDVSVGQVQGSSDSSYIEIADASLQTSVVSQSQKNHKQELGSDSSYVEVEERSLQTSTTNLSHKEGDRSSFSASEWDQISSENNDQGLIKGGNSESVTESLMKCDRICSEQNSSASNTRFSSDEDGSSDDSFTYLKEKLNSKENDASCKKMDGKISAIKMLNTDRMMEKCASHLDDSLPDIIPTETHSEKKRETRKKTDDCYAEFSSDSDNDVHDDQNSGAHRFEEVISSDSDNDLPERTSAVIPSIENVLSSDSDEDLQRVTGANKQGNTGLLSSDSDDFLSDIPYQNRKKTSVKKDRKTSTDHWRTPKHYRSDSSTDEEELESFFQKIKSQKTIPQEETPPKNKSLDDFIVDDDDVSSSENEADFYITTNTVFTTPHRKVEPIVLDDSEDDIFKSDIKPIKRKTKEKSQKTPASNRKRTERWEEEEEDRGREKYSFLKSLSIDTPDDHADREALRFSKNFKKMKEDLTKKLFKIYNDTVFDNQLPEDLQILWNNRLLKTAGYCVYRKNAKVHDSKTVRIELSTKVCDSAERVRDTLIHELCHAAVWLLHGKNDGHGPYWRIWAKKANLTHPEIPVIARCHSYSISTKYTYQCSKCGYSIGRHSKSLDTSRKVCGFCHGEFVLLNNQKMSRGSASTPATPRTPNKFAMYVKENYSTVKEKEKDLKHGDIMKLLGKQFAEKNKISS
eukprot:XP_011429648.1 PREDICTED: acidic repeat-containing protein [Crassostrea gigas]